MSAAAPVPLARAAAGSALLTVRDLGIEFPRAGRGAVRAVEGIDLDVHAGEIVCLVGESGCGKSVTVRSLFGCLPPPGRKGDGSIVFDGIDLATLDAKALRALCGDAVGYVFQDPMTYLNPLLTAGEQVAEAASAARDSRATRRLACASRSFSASSASAIRNGFSSRIRISSPAACVSA
jgi:ABC-type dipeptide/oligopeptide/nickel transport system ATPase component